VVEKDRIFMKNFSLLIAGMMVFTVVIIILAANMNGLAKHGSNPQRVKALETRIAPVSQSHVGADGEQAVAAINAEIDSSNAVAGAAPPAAAAPAAGDAPAVAAEAIDGGAIYNSVCFACHMAGVAGAPKLEQAAWEERIAKGTDVMVQNAITGFTGSAGMMPPKGGRMDLSDAEVEATVQWMLDNLE
jgi:cytochrome c5